MTGRQMASPCGLGLSRVVLMWMSCLYSGSGHQVCSSKLSSAGSHIVSLLSHPILPKESQVHPNSKGENIPLFHRRNVKEFRGHYWNIIHTLNNWLTWSVQLRGFSVFKSCAITTTINVQLFSLPQEEIPYPLAVTPHFIPVLSPLALAATNWLSVFIYVVFCGLLS